MKVKDFSLEIILFILFFLINFFNIAFKVGINTFLFLIVLYFFFLTRNVKYLYKLNKFFFLYIFYIIILIFLGIFNNNYTTYLYFDILNFFSILFVLILFRFNITFFYTLYLPKIGLIINVISIVFALYHLTFKGITFASITGGRGLDDIQEGDIISPKFYLYSSLFLYPLVTFLKNRIHIFIYHVSIILFILFSLAMASRGTTLIGIIVVLLTHIKDKNLEFNVKALFNLKTWLLIFFSLISLLVVYQITIISNAIDYLFWRFNEGEESIGASRTEEALDIYEDLTIIELIFGKGLGASNNYWIFANVENGVNNVHYGWMFLILKGGIFLMLLVYSKIFFSIYKLFNSKLLYPYAITLISFLFLEFAHTSFNSFLNLSFMFIALYATIVRNKEHHAY